MFFKRRKNIGGTMASHDIELVWEELLEKLSGQVGNWFVKLKLFLGEQAERLLGRS